MIGVFGGAALVGSLLYGAVGRRLPRRLTFLACYALVPVVYLVLATLPPFPVALAALAAGGLAAGPINPLLNTVLLELVPASMRGRVLGAVRAGAWAAVPLGILLGGAVVDAVGVAPTLLGIGVCYVAVILAGFANPAFRELDVRPAPPARGPAP